MFGITMVATVMPVVGQAVDSTVCRRVWASRIGKHIGLSGTFTG